MAAEKTSLYEDAITLLERINNELKESKQIDTLNSKMVSVVKDLNEVRIEKITGKPSIA
jgi:hypothetical protein